MLRYLIEKEFKQIRRNKFLPRMILMFPVMALLVFPWAANFEVRDINLSVVDHDHSSYSRRLVQKVVSSGYFHLADQSAGYRQALRSVETDDADIILVIPPRFERDLVRQQPTEVHLSANAVNPTKAGIGSSYLMSIVHSFSEEIGIELIPAQSIIRPAIEVVPRFRYNVGLSYFVFMVPALMVMVLTMVCGFLPALNVVGEKEAGTMEQMNVTPVSRFLFIFAKLVPYWFIGMVSLTLCFVVAWLAYGLSPEGSLAIMYLFSALYILGISGLGLIISNYSRTVQQAMFVMYFLVVLLIIMSGLFTPVESMPQWAQNITVMNPLKYFIQVMRQVYLKGSMWSDLAPQFLALTSFAVGLNILAVLSFRKRE